MAIEITYADEFDREHYPFSDKVYELVEKIARIIYHPDPENSKWKYFCTVHGAIFKTEWTDAGIKHRNGNLGINQIRAFADFEGLRWIESKEDHFTVGVEHKVVK